MERATHVFFQLLAEASLGNPSNALELWCDSLSLTENNTVTAHLSDGLTVKPLPHLSDGDMFTLAALYTHDTLSNDELIAVTNRPRSGVRASIKHLLARGIIHETKGCHRITTKALPAITLTLKRRHFVHWTD